VKVTVTASQEKMKAKVDTAIRAVQEKVEATINPIWSELEETIKNLVEDVLASVDQWTQGLCKEVNGKIEETELHLELVMMSLNIRTKGLREEIADAKKELCEEFELRTLDTRIDIHRMKTIKETKLAKVKTRVEHRSCGRTGTDFMGHVPTAV
jgi:hypothetical protein